MEPDEKNQYYPSNNPRSRDVPLCSHSLSVMTCETGTSKPFVPCELNATIWYSELSLSMDLTHHGFQPTEDVLDGIRSAIWLYSEGQRGCVHFWSCLEILLDSTHEFHYLRVSVSMGVWELIPHGYQSPTSSNLKFTVGTCLNSTHLFFLTKWVVAWVVSSKLFPHIQLLRYLPLFQNSTENIESLIICI